MVREKGEEKGEANSVDSWFSTARLKLNFQLFSITFRKLSAQISFVGLFPPKGITTIRRNNPLIDNNRGCSSKINKCTSQFLFFLTEVIAAEAIRANDKVLYSEFGFGGDAFSMFDSKFGRPTTIS